MKKKRKAGSGYSVGLSVHHVEMFPPRTIVCTACGVREDLKVEMPIFAFDSVKEFNRKVEAFVRAHETCEEKGAK